MYNSLAEVSAGVRLWLRLTDGPRIVAGSGQGRTCIPSRQSTRANSRILMTANWPLAGTEMARTRWESDFDPRGSDAKIVLVDPF